MTLKNKQSETQRIPKLRFSGFSGGWEERKLGDVINNIGGTALEKYVSQEGSHKFISIGNYSIDGKYIDNKQKIILNDKTKTKLLKRGDLVMILNDKTLSGDIIGSSILIDKNDTYIYNQRSERLIVNYEVATPNFLWALLNSRLFRKKVFKISQGGTQIYVNFPAVKKLKMNLPLLVEQQKIAEFLGSVDELIENLKEEKEFLKSYKKGIMQKIFSQEIRFKDEKGKEFPKWEEKKLGELLDYEQPTDYIVESTEYSDKYKIPVLTAGKTFILGHTNETKGIFNVNKLPVIIFDDFTTASQFVDFIFKVKSSAMKILVARKNVDIKFIYEFMQMIRYEIGGHGRHWISKYSKIKLPTPSFLEQRKIADFLTSIDNLIKAKQEQITQAEQFKKGLMQGLFV